MLPIGARLVLSTDVFPERERFDAWRETFALKIARVDATTPERKHFHGVIATRLLDRLCVIENMLSPVTLLRRREQISDGNNDICLVICLRASALVRDKDDAIEVRSGEATLLPHDVVGGVCTSDSVSTISVRVGRSYLRELVGGSDPPVLPLFSPRQPELQLLTIYLRALAANHEQLPAPAANIVDRHLAELIAAVLNPAADIVREGRFGGTQAARLKAVTQAIECHLADPGLNAAKIGARLGLSERYVQHLFAETGTTFSEFVRLRRLAHARRMLESWQPHPRSTAEIAYAAGFGDLSTFNHAFRRHFGCTPSDIRRRQQ